MDQEVTPLLAPVPGIDLAEYKATLLTRFANPAIKDQTARICLDGSSKVPKFLLPSLQRGARPGSVFPAHAGPGGLAALLAGRGRPGQGLCY